MNRAEKRRQQKEAAKAAKAAGKGVGVSPSVSQDVQATFQTAVQAHQAGNLADAETLYRQVLDHAPEHADAWHLLGVIRHQSGRSGEAVDAITRATAARPDFAEAHCNLGVALHAVGRLEDAAESYDRALAAKPDYPEALSNRGNVLTDLGRLDDAVASLEKALAIEPSYVKALNNLGNALRAQGKTAAAAETLEKALALEPGFAEAHCNLGAALHQLGRAEDAAESYRKALAFNPGFAEAMSNLGNVLNDLGRRDEAADYCRKAIALDPGFAKAHDILGTIERAGGRLDDAVDSHKKALALDPNDPEALSNLGSAYQDLGQLDEALESYEKAMAAAPDNAAIANNYLHTLLYVPGLSNTDLFAAFREKIADQRPSLPPPAPPPTPTVGDKLKIGYVSSDFHDHPVGRNILPILENHDHDRFEIFCYAQQTKQDDLTERFRGMADHWRVLNGLGDAEAARLIRDDGIHVMIYLGGHFDANRMMIATHRPAPVQAAMHGGATTALEEMDYWLTDAVLHPPEQGEDAEGFTEELIRLPNFYSYPPLVDAPAVKPLPALDNGFVTFCSFNKPCKMNGEVLDLWAEIMRVVPDSRLMLKFKAHLEVPSLRESILAHFGGAGIAPERIELVSGMDGFGDHLGRYSGADIALDPFPFAGATTTYQALWMGVPVVSLMGERFISRAGGSISTHAGLGDLVAETPEDYVAIAAALANDPDRLQTLRESLRDRVAASPLCDGPVYAANVEDAYRAIWARHHETG